MSDIKPGDLNAYDCETCGETYVFVYRDVGVTPMYYRCKKDNGLMVSRMHRGVAPTLKPTHEWYKPTAREAAMLSPAWQYYLAGGGLCDRRIESDDKETAANG